MAPASVIRNLTLVALLPQLGLALLGLLDAIWPELVLGIFTHDPAILSSQFLTSNLTARRDLMTK